MSNDRGVHYPHGEYQAVVIYTALPEGSAIWDGSVTITGTVIVSGTVTVDSILNPVAITVASLPLPANAAQETGGNLDSLVAKDFATETTLQSILAKQPTTDTLNGQTLSYVEDVQARHLAEMNLLQNFANNINTMLADESANSQRTGFELR